jgi:hypothetical protein
MEQSIRRIMSKFPGEHFPRHRVQHDAPEQGDLNLSHQP